MKKGNLFKVFSLLTLALTSVFALSACNVEDEEHTIVFYHTMGDSLQKVLQTAINDFEADHEGWKVQSSAIGGYDDVKKAVIGDLQGQMQPNLTYCYADHVAQYLTTGKVIDLNKYINSDNGFSAEEVADFIPGYYNEGKASNYASYDKYGYSADSMLTLPYVKSTEVLYYNATALIEAGVYETIKDAEGNDVKVADVPQTWDELWEACRKVKAKYPSCTPLGYDSEANWVITMCEQNGWGYTSADPNNHFLFNNENLINWMDDINEKYLEGLLITQEVYGSYTSGLFTKGAAEGSVFSIGSTGGASHQGSNKFTWGVAPIPGILKENGEVYRKAISQGPSLCMFECDGANGDEREDMTWEFVKDYLLNPTFLCKFSMASGYNPPRSSAYAVTDYQDFLAKTDDIVAVTANVAKEMTPYYYTSPAFVGSSTARDEMNAALTYVLKGNKDATKALADAYKNCGGK